MFPNTEKKHENDPLFTPEEFLEYKKKIGEYPEDKELPKSVILSYSSTLADKIKEDHMVEEFGLFDVYIVEDTPEPIAITSGHIGAPKVASLIEELAEMGMEKLVTMGYAGALDQDLDVGDIVIHDKALRDEGASYHYKEHGEYSYASEELTKELERALREEDLDYTIGPTWTIDTPYRETKEEVKKYRKKGIKTVEMEASAVFTVANYRGVEAAAVSRVSDHLTEVGWKPNFKEAREILPEIFEVAVDTLID